MGENLEKKNYNVFLILNLKWMQSRQAGVPGREGNPSLDKSNHGQFGFL